MSSKPHFYLSLRDGDVTGRVGVGWVNSAGGISLKLNPGTTLRASEVKEMFLTLWPTEELVTSPYTIEHVPYSGSTQNGKRSAKPEPLATAGGASSPDDDDIPF
jgi:hypothetical protein